MQWKMLQHYEVKHKKIEQKVEHTRRVCPLHKSRNAYSAKNTQSKNLLIPVKQSKWFLRTFQTNISCNIQTYQSRIYKVKGILESLLGKSFAEALEVLRVEPSAPQNVAHLEKTNENIPSSTKSIVNKYLFSLGQDFLKTFNNTTYHWIFASSSATNKNSLTSQTKSSLGN